MAFGVILDIGLLVLLAVTIGYCAAVHRRLQVLRAAQGEIRQVVEGFADATARAEHSVERIKASSDDTVRQLSSKIELARSTATELDVLLSRARKLARTEPARSAAPRPARPQQAKPPAPTKPVDEARSRAERELIRALQTAR